jgi:hypothetical protein
MPVKLNRNVPFSWRQQQGFSAATIGMPARVARSFPPADRKPELAEDTLPNLGTARGQTVAASLATVFEMEPPRRIA